MTSPRSSMVHAGALALVAAMLYLPFLGNSFVWEDRQYLVDHPATKDIRWIPKFFVPSVYRPAGWESAPVYRPLASLTYWLDQQVWGQRPVPRRMANLLIHVASAAAVWRLAGLFAPGPPAFWAALLYLAHPVHSETIFWVAARATPLAGAMVLWLAVWWLGGGLRRPWQAVPLYAAALLVKESALPLPGLLVLGDWLLGSRDRVRERRAAYLALALTAAGYLILRSRLLWMVEMPHLPSSLSDARQAVCLGLSTLTEAVRLIIWPVALSLVHALPDPPAMNVPRVWVGVGVASAGSAAIALAWRRAPAVAFGLAWAVFAWLPSANLLIIPGYPSVVSERHLYLPLAGLAIALAGLLARIPGATAATGWKAARVCLAGIIVAFAVVVHQRGLAWRDGAAVVHEYLDYRPRDGRAQYMYAYELSSSQRWAEAAEAYQRAAEGNPPVAQAWLNLGVCRKTLGDRAGAEAAFERAAGLLPADPKPHLNLGNLYYSAGQRDRAAAAFREAIRRRLDFAEPHRMLGKLAFEAGRLKEAEAYFAEFERWRPR